jgi:hypothetical protein
MNIMNLLLCRNIEGEREKARNHWWKLVNRVNFVLCGIHVRDFR